LPSAAFAIQEDWMMYRMKELLAVLLIALAGTQLASANPPASTSESAPLICPKLPPLWHGFLCLAADRYEQTIRICNELLGDDPDNRRAYALRGYAYLFKKGDGQKAIADFTEVLKRDLGNAAIYVARARANAQTKDDDRAIADCTAAIRLDPNYAEAYAERGICYLEKRVTNKAIADYSLALRHNPYLTWARCGRGEAYRRRGESARALADLEEALRNDPGNEQVHYNRCFVYLLNLRDCDRVIAESSERIQSHPKDAMWYAIRGMAYMAKGETTKGLRDWTTAASLKPRFFHFCSSHKPHSFRLGFSFGSAAGSSCPGEDDPDARIAACTKRLTGDPEDNVAAYWERGYSYYLKREYKRAIEDFDEIIRRDPADAAAFRNRGYFHHDLGAYTDALDDYAHAMRIDPGNADDYAGRACAYLALKKYEEALSDCTEALRFDPHFVLPYTVRGWIHLDCKQYGLAIADFSEAIRLSPNDSDLYQRRAEARKGIRDYAGVITDYRRIVELDPSNTHAGARLAGVLCSCPDASLRNGKEARKLATAACEATSWRDWESLVCLALACAECGDFDAAVKWETKAGEFVPDSMKLCNQKHLAMYRAHKTHHATLPPNASASHSSK
jgi:tetratricopeptide (TPR) repeat protein